ncbi:hypothetical protein HPB47_005663 [Ixodes persulcatus]|uniref:Uncharacterized protein n=1 Tax=Ixodes persulcatus TaxID=34615 RepID=A0AC60PCC6_IXOPE|nr:hypothetical protein HPB47_005663 [Ixodes persulcatus]
MRADDENGRDLKREILEELQLAPVEFRDLFYRLRRDEKESWGQFASRLGDFFGFYLKSSEVVSLDALRQLLVADQLKRTMHRDTRAYTELSEKGKWLPPAEVAKLAVSYERTQRETRDKQGTTFPNREPQGAKPKPQGLASGSQAVHRKRNFFGYHFGVANLLLSSLLVVLSKAPFFLWSLVNPICLLRCPRFLTVRSLAFCLSLFILGHSCVFFDEDAIPSPRQPPSGKILGVMAAALQLPLPLPLEQCLLVFGRA